MLNSPTGNSAAVCRNHDPEIFFPKPGCSGTQAKRICNRCPLIVPCGKWAVEQRIPYGVWGGLNVQDRKRIIKKMEVMA